MNPVNVLIIDDEVELGNATKEYFEAFGVTSAFCESAEAALAWLHENSADLVLLDINLKKENGFELCKTLRRTYDMPILFISARLSVGDILIALNIGGDDYITKPYELSVLLAKVKARLQRGKTAQKNISAGGVTLDFNARKAFKGGEDLGLKNKEFLLLAHLMQNAGKAMPKDEIFAAVWGDAFFSDGTLTVHIRKLREKIEENPESPALIKTVWGVGYLFEG